MKEYGKTDWELLWEKLEQAGNVGLDYVISPYLYSRIADYLNKNSKSLVVDFGCGTNVMGIQFLFGHKNSVEALKNIQNLDVARFNILLYIGIEGSSELVEQSNKYLKDIGRPKNIATLNFHIGTDLPKLFDDSSVDLCVSRNFLMHLSNEDLEFHFQYVARILKSNGKYIFATLNPAYEASKSEKQLTNGERYDFQHGKEGEHGIFYHYYRDENFFENILQKNFIIEEKINCFPVSEKFRETHARYYNKDIPMARVYVLKVTK